MIDLRYLALSLIAVFLALAVGLMLGSALGTPDRRDHVYASLEEQFRLLRDQNQAVREETDRVRRGLAARDQALADLQPLVLRGKLPGSVVGVVLCGQVEERRFWGALESAIRAAGGEVGPVLRVPDLPRPLSPGVQDTARRVLGPPPAGASPMETALVWCARAMVRPGAGGAAAAREVAAAAAMDARGNWSRAARRVLVLVGSGEPWRASGVEELPEVHFTRAALAEGARVVAAQGEDEPLTALDALRRLEVPLVDCIDTPAGQLAAVLALAGADGHFGGKPGAARAVPPVLPE